MKKIPAPPGNLSPDPDQYTAKDPDFTGDHAGNRVLHLKLPWIRYGTDDKGHAAALVLSALLLIVALIVCVIGLIGQFSGHDAPWVGAILSWIGNAFLFTAGIAVGKSAESNKKATDE